MSVHEMITGGRVQGPLSDLSVVEFAADVAAAWCARQFAAWGADVVIGEPAGGAALRTAPPHFPGTQLSALWEYVAAGKRSCCVTSPESRARLMATADVVVTDDGSVAESCPAGTVVICITPFGLTGPYADLQATDIVVQALSGYLSMNGEMGRAPLRCPGNILAYAPGVAGFTAGLAALRERDRSGCGQLVEISWMETVATMLPFVRAQYTGKPGRRGGGPSTGLRLVKTADGHVSLSVIGTWRRIIDALLICGVDVPVDAPAPGGIREIEDACARLQTWCRNVTSEQLLSALREVERQATLFDRVWSPAELASNDQLVAREALHSVDHPHGATLLLPGPPARLSHTPMQPPDPAPQHVGPPPPSPSSPQGPVPPLPAHAEPPLQGVRIVDLTQAWIGPYASMFLADLGADLVKVESQHRPDVWRLWNARGTDARTRTPDAHPGNVNANFNSVNRNKRSLCLDLSTPEGREVLLDLVSRADVLMENYRSGSMGRLGLADEVLRRANPDLVVVSFSGYGRTGPRADYHANGVTIETVAGWDALHGYPYEEPVHMGLYQADPITGLQMAACTLLALRHRERTGQAQTVDGSMLDAAVGYIGELVAFAHAGGTIGPLGNRHPSMAPHGVYPCRGEDRWVAIAVRDDAEFEALATVVPGLDGPGWTALSGRLADQDALDRRIADWTAGIDATDVMRLLQDLGVPAGVVQRIDEALDDPHLAARGWFLELEHPDMGTHRYNGVPWKLSRSPRAVPSPPARLGEHGAGVLAGELGLSPRRIRDLYERGITATVLSKNDGVDRPGSAEQDEEASARS